MGYVSRSVGILTALMFVAATVAVAEERDPLKPRVPPEQIAEAKAMKNPVENKPENIAKGKELFEGKGTCFNCHGKEGKGDGPAGQILNPSPRNFTNCKFHKKRKDGELFWVHVSGFTYTPEDPHGETIWAFTDLSTGRKVSASAGSSMTPRERDIAALLIEGKTGKEIGQSLGISFRTVDIYKTRLLRKFGVSNSPDLVKRLLALY